MGSRLYILYYYYAYYTLSGAKSPARFCKYFPTIFCATNFLECRTHFGLAFSLLWIHCELYRDLYKANRSVSQLKVFEPRGEEKKGL